MKLTFCCWDSDLDHLREQQQAQLSEKASLSSQSQAMLNLNMKLQSTVVRNQGKAVDFELRKLEAAQALQQLQIITPYLPNSFQEDDRAAIDALLFFGRLVCKLQILLNALDQTHGLQDGSYPDTVPEALVDTCQTRWRIARFMILCKRFAANLQRCEAQTFVRMGKVYVELLSMERRIDTFLDQAKKQELREVECGDEIDRYMAQAAHVAELHFGESDLDLVEQSLGQMISLDLDLDTFVVGVGYTKQALALVINDPGMKFDKFRQMSVSLITLLDVTVEAGGVDVDEAVFARLQGMIDSARALKATTKYGFTMPRLHSRTPADSWYAGNSFDELKRFQKITAR
jgi:dynactin 1